MCSRQTKAYLSVLATVYGEDNVPAVKTKLLPSGRMEMSVHWSLPPHEVAKAYRNARLKLTGKKRVRRISVKHVTIVEFCTLYNGAPNWKACMAAWNSHCDESGRDEWKYSQLSRFKRDARAARKRLTWAPIALSPEYSWDS